MTPAPQTELPRRNRLVPLLPLIGFLALAALFLVRLGSGDPGRIPSALIGRPAPMTSLPPVPGLERDGKPLPGLDPAEFQGHVSLVNVWASWCVPCHDEVAFLQQLALDARIRLVGINYKDQPDNARRFLNPLRQSVRGGGCRRERPRRHRMGRLRRAGDLSGRPRRPHRLQARRADQCGEFRARAAARAAEGPGRLVC